MQIMKPEELDATEEIIDKIMNRLRRIGNFYLSVIFCEIKEQNNKKYMEIEMVSHLPPELKKKVLNTLLEDEDGRNKK